MIAPSASSAFIDILRTSRPTHTLHSLRKSSGMCEGAAMFRDAGLMGHVGVRAPLESTKQSAQERNRVGVQGRRESKEFHDVDPALAAFIFSNKG